MEMDVQYVDNTNRFSGRAEAYVKHRRGYPPEAFDLIQTHFQVSENARILDMGSGTGILSRQLLEVLPSAHITGLEPNADMRQQQDIALASHINDGRFTSLNATAEATTLPDKSVDLALAGAAYHWFDPSRTRTEILRVVKPIPERGCPFIILNSGRSKNLNAHWQAFGDAMREFRRQTGTDHTERLHAKVFSEQELGRFFGGEWKEKRFGNERTMKLEELKQGVQSYSSNPMIGTLDYNTLMQRMEKEFMKWQENGVVVVPRETVMYYGYVRP